MPPDWAVIFDLDDTLYLERDYAMSGYQFVAERFRDRLGGDTTRAAEAMRHALEHGDRRHVFDDALRSLGIPADAGLILELADAYRHHTPRIGLADDAAVALRRLRSVARLGIITDGPAYQQKKKIDAMGVAPLVDVVILTDELGPGFAKPHPRAFESMADQIGAAAARCTYVADNPAKDFVAPNRLGWTTIRIVRPGGIYADSPVALGGAPQRTITSLVELS